MTKSKERHALELEAELIRLTDLVRARRHQLARLKDCPNPVCPCRLVWRDHVEKNLASQVRKIRKQVRGSSARGGARQPRRGNVERRA